MNPVLLGAVGLVAIVGGLMVSKESKASEANGEGGDLDALYRKHGERYGVDPQLLKAIGMVESSLRVDAVRWMPPYDVSAGLQQILCVPPEGVERGQDYICQNKFNIDPWPVRFSELQNPDLNIRLGAQILAWNLRTFGNPRGVAVYNMWAARHAGVNGPFPNQSYVDKVFRNLAKLKGEV